MQTRRFVGSLLAACACAFPASAGSESVGYREPSGAVVRLLTATPPPEPIVHARSGRLALLFREPVIELERLARPFLGLAGFRFDPSTHTSGAEPLVARVEVISTGSPPGTAPVEWRPGERVLLDHIHFSPDGRYLSAISVSDEPARLVLFDVSTAEQRELAAPVNPAWGDPCIWVADDALDCRVVPEGRGEPPQGQPTPLVVEHMGGAEPTRLYSHLLENAHEDDLFEHYFAVELARVGIDGELRRLPVNRGLIASVETSPGGAYAVLTRIERPFSRLVPAHRFPSAVEVWDLARGKRIYASSPAGFGVDQSEAEKAEPRRFAWKPGLPTTGGWVVRGDGPDGKPVDRWMALELPIAGQPREIARSAQRIRQFGWTTAGTPYFLTPTEDESGVQIYAVIDGRAQEIWSGNAADRYHDPGQALRADGAQGPVLEVNGRIFLAGDGLGPEGPRPFLYSFDLRSRRTDRLFLAESGTFERVIGLLDPKGPVFLTVRETETTPPSFQLLRGTERTELRSSATPYPDLANVERRVISYRRADGVQLSGTLYLPAKRRGAGPFPTLIWIYPHEFSDPEHAQQLDVRAFRFHNVKGPSPLAALLEGYAVLVNPTVPIIQEGGGMNDAYIPQLVASAEAAADYLISIGVSEPKRIAVGGRSYGAFSSANLLIHSKRFATAIAMSGAYNRTLTPFGFQHEKRSFWEATDLYANISPFFHADRIKSPILLVHGDADENPGTPPLQTRRFLHALVGQGAPVRYVGLPFEGHHYWARESVLHAAAELIDWLDRTIGPKAHVGARAIPSPRTQGEGCDAGRCVQGARQGPRRSVLPQRE